MTIIRKTLPIALAVTLMTGHAMAQSLTPSYTLPTPAGQVQPNATYPAVILCPGPNGTAVVCNFGSGVGTALVQTNPTGGNFQITTTPSTAIPAGSRQRVGYQTQGTGSACASWVTATISIAGSGSNAVCSGSGAFLLQPGSTFNTVFPFVPSSALTTVGSAGSNLFLISEIQ